MKTKDGNKGFSLVELIVVVLIMGIIAVALAPQVMKWVGTSKVSADESDAGNLKASINAAIADYMQNNNTVTCPSFGAVVAGDSTAFAAAAPSLITYVEEVLNGQWPDTQAHTNGYYVVVTETGAVTVYYTETGSAGSFK